jgi:hypothetical protein
VQAQPEQPQPAEGAEASEERRAIEEDRRSGQQGGGENG